MLKKRGKGVTLSVPHEGVDRREFLAAATGLASAALLAKGSEAAATPAPVNPASLAGPLAMEGGTPVRATMLEAKLSGPQYYDEEERRELVDVLENRSPFRWWGLDAKGHPPDKCINFEKEFAAHQNTKYCVAVTSGTTALMTAMAALEVGPGDEVILPAWTWYACYDAILSAGALPVFAEVDESMNLDPNDIERHITPHTKVVMAVHILGAPADMDPILAIAQPEGSGGLRAKRGRQLQGPARRFDRTLRDLQFPGQQDHIARRRRSNRDERSVPLRARGPLP